MIYRQALGFSKEPSVVVNSGGRTVMDVCSEIAETLFLLPEDSMYTKDDLDELAKCVSNRVIAIVRCWERLVMVSCMMTTRRRLRRAAHLPTYGIRFASNFRGINGWTSLWVAGL